jgi:hypothetical protein
MNMYCKLLGLTCLIFLELSAAYGRNYRRIKLGYDADPKHYFERQTMADNSIQLGFDAGYNLYGAEMEHVQEFRDVAPLDPSLHQYYFGFMVEKTFLANYVSASSGVYFMQLNSYLFGGPMGSGSALIVDYEDDMSVHHTSVGNVKTATTYVGIPLMARFEPINEQGFGLFVKAAIMASYAVHSATDLTVNFGGNKIDALTDEQQLTKDRIRTMVSNGDPLFAHAQLSVGARWGSYEDCNMRLEVGVPIALTSHLARLKLSTGLALRMTFIIPYSSFFN